MHKGRLEAFTDAVIAIILTIMVLELKRPSDVHWASLLVEWKMFASYAVSFTFLAIYWNNHHHMFQSVEKVDGGVLWANMHLLFWLSLTPFATEWIGQGFDKVPVAAYGILLFLSGLAYYILVQALLKVNGRNSHFAKALGNDIKGKISPVIYAVGVAISFVNPYISCALYVLVACMWLIPDRRFVRKDPEPEHTA